MRLLTRDALEAQARLEAEQRVAFQRALQEAELGQGQRTEAVPSPAELRGIPVCARNVPGHIRGTQPEQEVCRRER